MAERSSDFYFILYLFRLILFFFLISISSTDLKMVMPVWCCGIDMCYIIHNLYICMFMGIERLRVNMDSMMSSELGLEAGDSKQRWACGSEGRLPRSLPLRL